MKPGDIDDLYELSPLQQGILFHCLAAPEPDVYVITLSYALRGRLDRAAFERAWQRTVDRNPILRTSFHWEETEKPLQLVHRGLSFRCEELDWRDVPVKEQEGRLSAFLEEERGRGFTLDHPPLMRLTAIRTGEERHRVIWTFHHLLLEGWSASLVLGEVLAHYRGLQRGGEAELEPRRPYRDHIVWLQEQDTALAERYWRRALEGLDTPTPLPVSSPSGPPVGRPVHGRLGFSLPPETSASLASLSRRQQLTLNTVLQGAWAVLLSRYGGEEDVIFGSVVSGRQDGLPEAESMVGLFVNTLPARVLVPPDALVLPWLKQLQGQQLEMREHEHSSLVQIQGWSAVPRGQRLFESLFAFENWAGDVSLRGLDGELEVEEIRTVEGPTDYPLVMEIGAGPPISGAVSYDRRRLSDAAVTSLIRHYETLLEGIAAHPERTLSELPMMGPDERARLLVEWNATSAEYPREQTIGEVFRQQAERRPDAVAVVFEGRTLTYGELERRSNQLGRHLRTCGVGPDVRVGVSLERSLELPLALLGVLKAGGAYVPLDPDYPPERLRFLAEDSGVGVLLTQQRLTGRLASTARVVCVDAEWGEIARESGEEFTSGATAENLAYVTYTSGSTGVPKGVEVSHRGVLRLLFGVSYAELSAEETFLQLAPVSFDASTLELWGPLLHGGRCVVHPERVVTAKDLGEVIEREGVTTLWLTASLFNAVVDEAPEVLGGLKQLLIGGEALSVSHVRQALRALPGVRIINGYGPTESTTFTCCHAIGRAVGEGETSIPIGRPIGNTQVYVVDVKMRTLPVGVAGELLIGGDGLARGYLDRPGLTAEKFVPNPFSTDPGARLYRTGDRVRWREDGALEFLGRLDQQVKIRGFRVEPGEVESVLARHSGVKDAVVVVREDQHGDKRLVAYVTAREGESLERAGLREWMERELPAYMVPSAVLCLDALPLNANGKVDRLALPAPEGVAGEALDGPRSPIERDLSEIWARVLGRDAVGVHDDFFALGGHSLLATRVVSQVRKTFAVELPLRRLFESPTVAALARTIEGARGAEGGPVAPPIRRGAPDASPLSFAQQRLWFLDQLGAGAAYNIPGALRLRGRLDEAALRSSLEAVVRRHEVLRTTFPARNGNPTQVVHPETRLSLEQVDLRSWPEDERETEARRRAIAESERPFDLSRDPLLRATLLRLDESERILLLTIHHIAADGWSVGVLVRELGLHYRAYAAGEEPSPPELPVQYRDFALWQREWLQGHVLERQLAYWRETLGGSLPPLDLPTDRPRPAVQGHRGGLHSFELPPEVGQPLRALSQREGATLFMVLLAGFTALLSRYTGQEDLIVGSPIANRNRREIEGLIGFFVNSLALRIDLSGDPTFRELVVRIKEVTLGAYDHQDLPFERLVEELQPERKLSQNPVFQVAFALQNAASDQQLDLPGVTVASFSRGTAPTRFDLETHVAERGDAVVGTFVYDADLFDAATIAGLADHYRVLVAAAVARPDERLSMVPLVGSSGIAELRALSAGPQVDHPAGPVHVAFSEQASRTPNALAVATGEARLTYGELDRRSNQLARLLRGRGVGPDVVVGICAERSLELVLAALAVLKAGGAYLPMDPAYPQERLAFMIEDSSVPVLLTTNGIRKRLPESAAAIVCLEGDGPEIAAESDDGLEPAATTEHLAYVIYTSGSTGRPKGVELEHRGLSNLVGWHRRAYDLGGEDRATLVASPAFDASVWEIWPALVAGASLHIPDEETRMLPGRLRSWLAGEGITTTFLPTPLAEAVLREPDLSGLSLRVLLTGGDKLHRLERESLPFLLVNHYGPTENTVVATFTEVDLDAAGDPPIGRPIDNAHAFILDSQMNLVPNDVTGELYIGGRGLARGYRGRPELTAERFVPNPFGPPSSRLYRTGDVVRRRTGGQIEFLGRNDEQVKLRGHRIELGEVEAALVAHPGVREAVAVAREDQPGQPRLVAYVVPERSTGPSPDREQQHLSQWQLLYDETYDQGRPEKADFDITGWNSSYTGRPIPAADMQEWVDTTCQHILVREPQRVLEIGCGTGLLLSRIAPSCERYVGSDFSETALQGVRQRLLARPDLEHVQLLSRLADDFTGLDEASFDAVVLNSVVQYFPGAEYLLRVLEGALRLVAPGGFVFVGDVRNLRLLESYHASVQLFQAPEALPVESLRQRIRQRIALEEELVVDPGFFLALKRQWPEVGPVEIQPKRGLARNELTAYRYDVVIPVGGPGPEVSPGPWLDWVEAELSRDRLEKQLAEDQPPSLALRGVPNALVAHEVRLLQRLRDGVSGTVADLRAALAGADEGVSPGELRALAEAQGYRVETSWARSGADGRFDALLTQRTGEGTAGHGFPDEPVDGRPWSELTNDPLLGKAVQDLVPRLRADLEKALPEPMVPSAFVVLEALPLTGSGKVDRRGLPSPESTKDGAVVTHVPPRGPVEEALEGIFAEVLGRDRVGVHDDFFALGGHSLLATQVVSRVRDVFRAELPLRALFEAPTVAGLAARVQCEAGGEADAPPVTPAEREGPLPLSFAQERLWFLDQLYPGNPAYNMPFGIRIAGRLDLEALERSLREIVERHETLRTTFATVDGRPIQIVSPSASLELPVTDLRSVPAEEREAALQRQAEEHARRPFDLAEGPLLRVRLVRLDEEAFALLLVLHHVISDGWSMGVFARELSALYQVRVKGEASPLPELPVQYADFAVWQRDWMAGPVLERELSYWRGRLAGLPPLELPTDRPRPAEPRFRGATHAFALPSTLKVELESLSRREGATPFMTLLAAFQLLLARYADQDDLAVGSPIAGRNRSETEGLIGFFINSIVLRTDLSGRPSFTELLRRVRETALGAYAHQDLPFEKLVEELQPERHVDRNPLFQVSFAVQNAPFEPLRLGGLTLSPLGFEAATTRFDLSLSLWDGSAGLNGSMTYNTDLFEASTIARMSEHFQRLLEGIVADPDRRVSELSLLAEVERQRLLVEWNATKVDHEDGHATLHGAFERQAERTPVAVAVVADGGSLTYEDLERRSNQLAHHLTTLGVGPESRVGILLDRSLELPVALLGTLKAGGAWLPLDPSMPGERLAFMLEDARVEALLTSERHASAVPGGQVKVVPLDRAGDLLFRAPESRLDSTVDGEQLAYVMYTSGSTGRPKGVMVPHRAILNHILWAQAAFPLGAKDRVLQKTTLNFDASVWECFAPLLAGSRLVLARPEGQKDSTYLAEAIRDHGITVLKVVPSLLRVLLEEPALWSGTSLRTVLCGGETLSAELARRFGEVLPGVELHNLYGPTEAAVDVLSGPASGVRGEETVGIGRPIHNTGAHVLDPQGEPVPVGIPGELYVSGRNLARGYFGNPELTAEAFLPDPFSGEPGSRMYRTGDRVRRRPGGEIEFLGRVDRQLKVRGFRVEPGEIESVLSRCPGVDEAVVIGVGEVPWETRLVAYVTPGQGQAPEAPGLRGWLQDRLPAYMIPAAFVVLEALPLSPSGKVDRRALPAPERSREAAGGAYAAPRSVAEETLAEIWAAVLGLEQVGVHDNFFALGGDSILSIRMVSRAKQAGLHLGAIQVFRHQTIAELASACEAAVVVAEQGAVTGTVPLTPIQRRFFERQLAEPHHYNQSFLLEPRERLEPARLERALDALIRHHDALRLRFHRTDGAWRQEIVAADTRLELSQVDLSSLPEEERAQGLARAAIEAQASLDLTHGPVLRPVLFDLGPDHPGRLLLVVHHLAVDGVSWRVLLEDLESAYAQPGPGQPVQLPAKTTSFKAWSERLTAHARSTGVRAELDYWLQQAETEGPRLPRDLPNGVNTAGCARTITVSLDSEETRGLLRDLTQALGVDITEVLLATLGRVLARWTGRSSTLVDVERHGREDIGPEVDVSRTVGWFTSVHPVKLEVNGASNPVETVETVGSRLRRLPSHGIGYGLLRYLGEELVAEPLRRAVAAEVSFNYLGQLDESMGRASFLRFGGEWAGPWRSPAGLRSHLLEVSALVLDGALRVAWTYGETVHRQRTVEALAEDFVETLRDLVREAPTASAEPSGALVERGELDEALGEVAFE